jgi:hypothetical protein
MSTTTKYYAAAEDVQIVNSGTVWATVRDASSGSSMNQTENLSLYCYKSGTTYYIYRYSVDFDTAGIIGTITKVTFGIVGINLAGSGRTYNIYGSTAGDAKALGDYSKSDTTAYTDAGFPDSSWAYAPTLNTVDFNATGIAAVNKSGRTKVCFKSATNDAANSAPDTTICGLSYKSRAASGTANDPYLEVTYTTPSATKLGSPSGGAAYGGVGMY